MKKRNKRHVKFSGKKVGLIIGAVVVFLIVVILLVAGRMSVFIPHLAGITGIPFQERNYLVVFQNDNELRPGGGFVTSYGIVKFYSGFFQGIAINDVYGDIDDHDYVTPPYPMEKMLANRWYQGYTFRDANFYADFPTSAQELVKMYAITNPDVNIDGVFSLNYSFIEGLLDITGPVEVEGLQLNSTNLFETIENEVNNVDRHNAEQLFQRKGILKPLASVLIKKVVFNPINYGKVSDYIALGMDQKDIQLYFNDASLEEFVMNYGWSGAWPNDFHGDFLAVVESNLGGMKADRYFKRDVTYHVKVSEDALNGKDSANATLDVELLHYGVENIPVSGPYTGYFRFYKNPTEERPSDEIVKMMPGESRVLSHSFSLPESVFNDKKYSLYIPKQSGTDGDNYTVIISLPVGYQIESDDFVAKENIAYFEGPLNEDLLLSLKVLDDKLSPRIIHQQLSQLGKISVHFNEDMSDSFLSDPLNYQVIDLDKNNSVTTDTLYIRGINTTSKDVHINVSGMTLQPEEHYGVTLRNLRDKHGNYMPDRQITVVQRLE